MIAVQYIREAIRIRKRYESIVSLLDKYEREVKELHSDLLALNEQVKEIRPSMKGEIKDKKVLETITTLQRYESKLEEKIKPLQVEMDALRKQSNSLYDALKERYPYLSDDELKKDLFSQIQ